MNCLTLRHGIDNELFKPVDKFDSVNYTRISGKGDHLPDRFDAVSQQSRLYCGGTSRCHRDRATRSTGCPRSILPPIYSAASIMRLE